MTHRNTSVSLVILASTCIAPTAAIAGNGQAVIPFGFGAAIGAMQQMQQQQYLLQQQQNIARQQAATAWSRLGPAVLGCIAQNYKIDGPQFGYAYGISPNDGRYVGMVQQCAALVAQEQQRQRERAEQERQRQEADRQQEQAPRFIDRDPSHPGALESGEWAPHGYRETRLTDPQYREEVRLHNELEERQRQAAVQQALQHIYGKWSLNTSDLCPGTHWEFSSQAIRVVPQPASDKPTTAQYEVRGDSVTIVNTYPDGHSYNVYLKTIDDDTMEMRGTGASSVIRRCQSMSDSKLMRCAEQQVFDDMAAFSWYGNAKIPRQYIQDTMKKIADTVNGGHLLTACEMVQDLKQEIARGL